MKRFAMIVLAAVMVVGGIGVASAQMHGSRGGGAVSAGGHGGGSWQGGGSWHGGSNWNGGNWHGGHSRFVIGVGFGAPFWGWGWWPGYWPGYYYPAYYPAYPAYPYTYEPYSYDAYPSGTYIEQNAPASSPARGDYSYYCPDPAGYYPQVRTCAKGWLRVVPQNAPGPTGPTSY